MKARWSIGGICAALALIAVLIVGSCSHGNGKTGQPAHSASAKAPNIFTLLPFSQQQLDTAYTAAGHAAKAYETFTYTDTPQTYGARIAPWVTPGYLAYLKQTYGNATATANRIRLREHSTAVSSITAIRTFGPNSLTFIVHIEQHDPGTSNSGDYAVTTSTTDGRQWRVSDIEPAGAGNS